MNSEKFNDAMCRLRQAEEDFNKALQDVYTAINEAFPQDEICVGDEVLTDSGIIGIIIDIGNDDNGVVWISYRVTPAARGLDFCWVSKIKCKKTGRHFDSIPFDYNPEKGED